MNDFLYINHANDYALDVGAEVFHPMVSVVHFDELGEIRHSLNKMGVYAIFVQDNFPVGSSYGMGGYDTTKGSLTAAAPGQTGGVSDNGEIIHIKGWVLLFSPELLYGTDLGRRVDDYHFFSYYESESLHPTPDEQRTIEVCFKMIRQELRSKPDDEHLRRIIIVVGYKSENLIRDIGERHENIPIEFIQNRIYDKTNNIYSLALAKDKMEEDDTILLESDIIFNPEMLKVLVDNPYPNIALVAKWASWMDGTVVKIDDKCNIVSMVPKEAFNFNETAEYYKTVNIYKFSKEFAKQKYNPFLEAYCKSMGYNAYYEQVLNIITYISANEMKALPVRDLKWFEIDDIQDKEIAEVMSCAPAKKAKRMSGLYGGYWRFPDLLDFCYLVNPYFPTQHLKEEIKASFDVLLTNYPSGMAVNSMLAGKCFNVNSEHIVVGNGAAELIKSLMEMLDG